MAGFTAETIPGDRWSGPGWLRRIGGRARAAGRAGCAPVSWTDELAELFPRGS